MIKHIVSLIVLILSVSFALAQYSDNSFFPDANNTVRAIAVNDAGEIFIGGGFTSLGGSGWLPAVGDYDGDGKADPALYNESTGEWQVRLSGSNCGLFVAILAF